MGTLEALVERTKFNAFQLNVLRDADLLGIDLYRYCDNSYSAYHMFEILMTLEHKLDVSPLLDSSLSEEEVISRRLKIFEKADILAYTKKKVKRCQGEKTWFFVWFL